MMLNSQLQGVKFSTISSPSILFAQSSSRNLLAFAKKTRYFALKQINHHAP